jgi:hypothetical protein
VQNLKRYTQNFYTQCLLLALHNHAGRHGYEITKK